MAFLTNLVPYNTKRSNKISNTWIECIANDKFVLDRQLFEYYKPIKPIPVLIWSRESMFEVVEFVRLRFDNKEVILQCKHDTYFKENLIYLSILLSEFHIQVLNRNPIQGAYIKFKQTNQMLHTSEVQNGFYPIPVPMSKNYFKASSTNNTEHTIEWHSILAHIGPERISKASLLVDGNNHI